MHRFAQLGLAMLAVAAIPATSAFASAEQAAEPLAAEKVEQARQLFNDWSCSQCHTLADAGSSGSIGPALDGNANITHDYAVDRITNGAGPMPGFGGQMTDEEIDLLATYIVQAKK